MANPTTPRRRWFHSLSGIVVIAVGGVLLVAGAGPILCALVVANQRIDDGVIDPSDSAVMAEWDAWAFTTMNFTLASVGALVLAATYVYFVRRAKRVNPPVPQS